MNKLEEEIWNELQKSGLTAYQSRSGGVPEVVESAAKVALKWIEKAVEETIQVCKEHTEDGCFDSEGAEANALRIVKAMAGISEPLIGSEGLSDPPFKTEEV